MLPRPRCSRWVAERQKHLCRGERVTERVVGSVGGQTERLGHVPQRPEAWVGPARSTSHSR